MASESESESAQSQTRSVLERLITSRNRDLSLFPPFIFGLHGSDPNHQTEHIILMNPLTQGMVVIEGANINSLFGAASDPDKTGRAPASKASIDALPGIEISEGEEVGDCAICLEELGIEGCVKEMPCKHRFHGGCLERWLGIHGSCPVLSKPNPKSQTPSLLFPSSQGISNLQTLFVEF